MRDEKDGAEHHVRYSAGSNGVDIDVETNNNFTFSKDGLIAGKKKGEYTLKITITYDQKDTAIAQPFNVI